MGGEGEPAAEADTADTAEKSYQMHTAEAIFRMTDANGDGNLTKAEIYKFVLQHPELKAELNISDWDKFIRELDGDGDGAVDIVEWAAFCEGYGIPSEVEPIPDFSCPRRINIIVYQIDRSHYTQIPVGFTVKFEKKDIYISGLPEVESHVQALRAKLADEGLSSDCRSQLVPGEADEGREVDGWEIKAQITRDRALSTASVVVVMGTADYGQKDKYAACCTSTELDVLQQRGATMILVKMCTRFREAHTRVRLAAEGFDVLPRKPAIAAPRMSPTKTSPSRAPTRLQSRRASITSPPAADSSTSLETTNQLTRSENQSPTRTKSGGLADTGADTGIKNETGEAVSGIIVDWDPSDTDSVPEELIAVINEQLKPVKVEEAHKKEAQQFQFLLDRLEKVDCEDPVKCGELLRQNGIKSPLDFGKISVSEAASLFETIGDHNGVSGIDAFEIMKVKQLATPEAVAEAEEFLEVLEQKSMKVRGLDVTYERARAVYDARNYELAVELSRVLVEHFDYSNAMFLLGLCYHHGHGVEKDPLLAHEWYSKACPKLAVLAVDDQPQAQFNLGQCYELGLGIDKNLEEAVKWYQKASRQNSKHALLSLGKCFFRFADPANPAGDLGPMRAKLYLKAALTNFSKAVETDWGLVVEARMFLSATMAALDNGGVMVKEVAEPPPTPKPTDGSEGGTRPRRPSNSTGRRGSRPSSRGGSPSKPDVIDGKDDAIRMESSFTSVKEEPAEATILTAAGTEVIANNQ